MDADFNLRYNFEQHLENSNEDPPENDLEILESLFAEEMTVEEVTEVVLQDACASVSTRDAERERCSKLFQEKGRRIPVLLNLKGLKLFLMKNCRS